MKPDNAALTERQRRVLAVIEQFISERGFPPSYDELRQQLGYASLNAVSDMLRVLERKGYLQRLPGRSRAIALTKHPSTSVTTPVPSRKAETIPIIGTPFPENLFAAFLRPRGLVIVDSDFFELSGKEFFAAIAENDDFASEGIRRGDILIVLPSQQPPEGSLVICTDHIGGQILRRCSRSADGIIELRPARRGVPVIRVEADNHSYRIVGVVCGVMRKL